MGLILSEKEWAKEWDDLIKLSSISKKIVELEDGQETYYSFILLCCNILLFYITVL